jgi:hypothetical protein
MPQIDCQQYRFVIPWAQCGLPSATLADIEMVRLQLLRQSGYCDGFVGSVILRQRYPHR